MQFAHLGRSGVIVSRLCLGTMNFGWGTDEKDSFEIMDTAMEAGINFFDTANVYGFAEKFEGITETLIGKWLAQGNRRENIVLATKVFVPMGNGPNDRGLSAYHIRQAVDDSLRRMQTDHIDLLYMHHIDRGETPASIRAWFDIPEMNIVWPPHLKQNTRWEEIWQAMEVLVQQGKVLYVASSNFAGWNVAQACETANARHFLGLVAEQTQYNLNSRIPELEMIPACREYGVGLVPYSPLSEGLLAGGLADAKEGRRAMLGDKVTTLKDKIESYESLCHDLGESPANVALAWLLHNPVVTAPIVGPRILKHVTNSLGALDISLDDATMKKLDEIWPGPGGEAPEAYAW